ncbi:MAG: ABC transporter ATP-binding protein, partial [Hyphomonas sp.]|nr:ABC transporter ATP-binding protein [Hyphomonas sp.]
EPPEMLLLDEPTNHLDMDTIETLETALKAYDGALLVISHDPAFLTAIGITRTIALP